MTDEEAVAALARGDVAALEILVTRHGARAQHLAFGITRDVHTAQDVVADSFLSLVKQARRFDPDRAFAPWFTRIVVNRSISAAKRRQRWLTLPIWGLDHLGTGDPERLAELGEIRDAIRLAFSQLDPRDRAVVVLRLVLDASEADAADALACPVGTIKSRLARARRQLKSRLGEYEFKAPKAIGEYQ
jgi:RNA polymerase sigma-70 factor (ECF subfamily)